MSSFKILSHRNWLHFTYWTVKLSGFVPFHISQLETISKQLQILPQKSLPSRIYSTLIAFMCTILLLFGLVQADSEFIFSGIFLKTFVYSFEDLFVMFKFIVFIAWQICHRNQLISLINNGSNIWHHILKVIPSESFYDERQLQMYKLKFVLSFVEFAVKLLPILMSIKELSILMVTNYLIEHMSIVAINDVFYFGMMSVVLRFYRSVNIRILTTDLACHDEVCNRMQRQCNASDQLDRLAILYGQISMYVDDVRKCFQFQILFGMFTTSTSITLEVNLNCNSNHSITNNMIHLPVILYYRSDYGR